MSWLSCSLTEAAISVDNCGNAKSFTSRTGAKCSCKEACKKVGNCCEDYREVCKTKKAKKGSKKESKNSNSSGQHSKEKKESETIPKDKDKIIYFIYFIIFVLLEATETTLDEVLIANQWKTLEELENMSEKET
jgi:hypothetical protein